MLTTTAIIGIIMFFIALHYFNDNWKQKFNRWIDKEVQVAHKDIEKIIEDELVMGRDLEFVKYYDVDMMDYFLGSVKCVLKRKDNKYYQVFYEINYTRKLLALTGVKLMQLSDVKFLLEDDIELYKKYIGI